MLRAILVRLPCRPFTMLFVKETTNDKQCCVKVSKFGRTGRKGPNEWPDHSPYHGKTLVHAKSIVSVLTTEFGGQ